METELTEHTWRLSDPGMDLLERAGLAGLMMALQAASDAGHDLSPLRWTDADLTDTSVTVRWSGPAKAAFQKLIDWAWQVRDGVLYFPAIHNNLDASHWHLRAPMHNGIMRTFFQHPNVQPKMESVSRVVQLDDEKQVRIDFESPAMRIDDNDRGINPKTKRVHKKKVPSTTVKPHEDFILLFDKRSGNWKKDRIKISNWIYPGIAERYGAEGSWEGDPDRALLLLVAPSVCLYLRLQGKGNNWVVALPDIRGLHSFSSYRGQMKLLPEFVDVASLGDAGLKYQHLAKLATQEARTDLATGCRVIAMGYVNYYQGQSIRKSVLDLPPVTAPLRRYWRLHSAFPNHFQRRKVDTSANPKNIPSTKKKNATAEDIPQGNGWYKLPTGRGRIADNLVSGRPWYRDLFVPLSWDLDEVERTRKQNAGMSAERLWFTALTYQGRKLMALVNEPDMWDDPNEKRFVEAFWETLRALYKKEAKAIDRGGSRNIQDRWKHLIEDIRRKLMLAKTQRTSRAALAELFAMAGSQPTVAKHASRIWNFMNHPDHWQKGRDLALLAMVSYPRKSKATEVK